MEIISSLVSKHFPVDEDGRHYFRRQTKQLFVLMENVYVVSISIDYFSIVY